MARDGARVAGCETWSVLRDLVVWRLISALRGRVPKT